MNPKILALFVIVSLMAVSSYAASFSVPFEHKVDTIGKYYFVSYVWKYNFEEEK